MKKILTLLLGSAVALSASAITLEDLTGHYQLEEPYGSSSSIVGYGVSVTYGIKEGDTEANQKYINDIQITTDGTYLYFDNFLGFSFYGVANLEARTVTLPVQYITAASGYSFTLCKYEDSMFPAEGETTPKFTDDDEEDIVLEIDEDNNIQIKDEAMMALWAWNTNYLYMMGNLHKTSDFIPDEDVVPILGSHTCTEFKGEWCSIWGTWSEDWYKFDAMTGEGMDQIGCDPGKFAVSISSLGGKDVVVNGLWWGGLSVKGTYDPTTRTITFPLQYVWSGYIFCNSSLNDVEVPTSDDVVPATAVFNKDGSVTLNYTVSYNNYPYLIATQTLDELTMDDLTGIYELENPYGSGCYVTHAGYTTFGIKEGDTEANKDYINRIKVTSDSDYLYFNNFLGFQFYAIPDLEARTVTIPVQYVTVPTGYSFMLCKYNSGMFGVDGAAPTFKDEDAEAIVLTIDENGDLKFDGNEMMALWYKANYLYINGTFHKTADFVPSAETEPILGTYTCTEFKGEWCSIWGEWSDDWYKFDAMTGEGMERIGCDPGAFDVTIETLDGDEVAVSGLWWGALSINGNYDAETKTITFPLQLVWSGYTLCNSSLNDIEVPTAADVVPATAVFNEDGSVTLNYTVSYNNAPYLIATQGLDQDLSGVEEIRTEDVDNSNAPAVYYNLQGIRVNNPSNGLYIIRQGNKTSKQVIR